MVEAVFEVSGEFVAGEARFVFFFGELFIIYAIFFLAEACASETEMAADAVIAMFEVVAVATFSTVIAVVAADAIGGFVAEFAFVEIEAVCAVC